MSISSRLHGLIYAGEAVQEKFPKRPNLFPSRYRERDYEPKWLWDNDIKYNNVEEFARSSPDLNIIFFIFLKLRFLIYQFWFLRDVLVKWKFLLGLGMFQLAQVLL